MSEAMPADTTAQTTTNPLTDLTGFQIELLVAIDSHDDRPSGQMVKNPMGNAERRDYHAWARLPEPRRTH